MPLFDLKHVSKIYRNEEVETVALRDVSLTIDPGEFVAIMGPSGSGKSTLLQMMGFLDDPTDGEFSFDGKSWRDYSRDELAEVRNARMGFVFQSFNLLARTSVFENVKLPLWYSRIPSREWDERTRAAVERVGLTHRIDHVPSRLSGGEKQRVAIARALINNPDVIFADEPTGNLDSKTGQNIMQMLQELHREHKHTVILITHETDTAKHAQRIITVRDGMVESDKRVRDRKDARTFRK